MPFDARIEFGPLCVCQGCCVGFRGFPTLDPANALSRQARGFQSDFEECSLLIPVARFLGPGKQRGDE